ncbi:MAG: hypothetical protein [Bacteriophage sp.]|nr:MAG: hypothetical protein [Bacteriophage sp.]
MGELIVFLVLLPFMMPLFGIVLSLLSMFGFVAKSLLDFVLKLILPQKIYNFYDAKISSTIAGVGFLIILLIAGQALFIKGETGPSSNPYMYSDGDMKPRSEWD